MVPVTVVLVLSDSRTKQVDSARPMFECRFDLLNNVSWDWFVIKLFSNILQSGTYQLNICHYNCYFFASAQTQSWKYVA